MYINVNRHESEIYIFCLLDLFIKTLKSSDFTQPVSTDHQDDVMDNFQNYQLNLIQPIL